MPNFPLDTATIKYLQELNSQMRDAQMEAAKPFALKMHAALELTIRLNGLTGAWKPNDDLTELIPADNETVNHNN